MNRRRASRTGGPKGRTRGSGKGRRVRPGQSSGKKFRPNPGRGPLASGKPAKVVSIVYQVGGQKYEHKFTKASKGVIRLPKSAVKNGWIE